MTSCFWVPQRIPHAALQQVLQVCNQLGVAVTAHKIKDPTTRRVRFLYMFILALEHAQCICNVPNKFNYIDMYIYTCTCICIYNYVIIYSKHRTTRVHNLTNTCLVTCAVHCTTWFALHFFANSHTGINGLCGPTITTSFKTCTQCTCTCIYTCTVYVYIPRQRVHHRCCV